MKKSAKLGLAAGAVLVAAVVGSFIDDPATPAPAPTPQHTSSNRTSTSAPKPTPAAQPGDPAVYRRIAKLRDCEALQAEFDTASRNNAAATPGTPRFTVTLAYMTAAQDRMKALGCN